MPVVALGGLHSGSIEMFAQDRIESLDHLTGAGVPSTHKGGLEHIFISTVRPGSRRQAQKTPA